MTRRTAYAALGTAFVLSLSLIVPGCQGDDGDTGPPGTVSLATYAGSSACQTCHPTTYDTFMLSGHPYKLTPVVGGVRPTDPPFGGYPANPPTGYTWADVSYIIGGFGWKARFVDNQGYVVTSGAAANPVQFNIADSSWTTYHTQDEPGTKPYDCGPCHTTGYVPTLSQGGLPGIVGGWSEPGVRCEECHGPGSLHVNDPFRRDMTIDRSAELCGQCHIRGSVTSIPASGGFIRHHEQWNEIFASKKRVMDCVDCHNPHQSAHYADPVLNPDKGIRSPCEDCHFKQAAQQASPMMLAMGVRCIDCHMPYITKSALGDAPTFTGDVRTHLFAINTDQTAQQFNVAGDESNPYVTLDWSCNHCHGVTASVRTPAELEARATGYHD